MISVQWCNPPFFTQPDGASDAGHTAFSAFNIKVYDGYFRHCMGVLILHSHINSSDASTEHLLAFQSSLQKKVIFNRKLDFLKNYILTLKDTLGIIKREGIR